MNLKFVTFATTIAVACVIPLNSAQADMSHNKETVLRSVKELWSRGDLPIADALYGSEFVCHNLVGPDWHGTAGIKHAVEYQRSAFPDWDEHVDDIIAEGDRVVIRFTATGTQRGDFVGIAATNRKVTVREISIYRVLNGKIVEQWGMPDINGLLTQLRKPA